MFKAPLKTILSVLIVSQLVACQSVNSNQEVAAFEVTKGQEAFKNFEEGDLEWVALGDLVPTQMNIGLKQNAYKLARWEKEPEKMFEELCETYGMRGSVVDFNEVTANAHEPDSFQCKQPRNKEGQLTKDATGQLRAMDAITPVYVAPNGELYLTDGHHTNSRFHDMQGGGKHLPVLVKVVKNLSALESMDQFWVFMNSNNNVYLLDNGQAINYTDLPKNLGAKGPHNLQGMGNDEFRAVTYYTRDIGWDKGEAASVPFLEYYWAEEVRPRFTITGDESITEYAQIVLNIANYMVDLTDDHPLGDSGKNTKELGKMDALPFDSVQDVIETTICEWDKEKAAEGKMKLGKLGWAFYKQGIAIENFPVPCNEPSAYKQRYDLLG